MSDLPQAPRAQWPAHEEMARIYEAGQRFVAALATYQAIPSDHRHALSHFMDVDLRVSDLEWLLNPSRLKWEELIKSDIPMPSRDRMPSSLFVITGYQSFFKKFFELLDTWGLTESVGHDGCRIAPQWNYQPKPQKVFKRWWWPSPPSDRYQISPHDLELLNDYLQDLAPAERNENKPFEPPSEPKLPPRVTLDHAAALAPAPRTLAPPFEAATNGRAPEAPAAATPPEREDRTAELVKFLESRPGRKATLEEITLAIYKARPANVATRSRTTRKMAERARTKLEHDGASVRLSIEKKTVFLVPANGDAT